MFCDSLELGYAHMEKCLQDPLRDTLDSISPYSCVIVTVAATCGT